MKIETLEDLEKRVQMDIRYVAEVPCDHDPKRTWDKWSVSIWYENQGKCWTTCYHTGLGHRKKGRLVKPKKADVLYCLFSDAELGSYSFNDFCDYLGLSNDSFKAFDSYKACMETAENLRRCFTSETYNSIQELVREM